MRRETKGTAARRTRRTPETDPAMRAGYSLPLDIPPERWTGTDTPLTERGRAAHRAWARQDKAGPAWKALRDGGNAWRVGRFVAVIAVSAPGGVRMFPPRAAETVKPVIDAGTDARLWEDDDSLHRCSTVYVHLPSDRASRSWRLTTIILPVPARNPSFQIAHALGDATARTWKGRDDAPEWPGGYVVRFDIPDRQWVTSNFSDSDLAARQHGRRRSDRWGDGGANGVRRAVTEGLARLAGEQWSRQPHVPYDRFIVLAGVSYPYGVTSADPDNAAETVNAIMEAGIGAGAWESIGPSRCKAVAFFRQPNLSRGHLHRVTLYVLPVPQDFQTGDALADAASRAWAEYDRRLR